MGIGNFMSWDSGNVSFYQLSTYLPDIDEGRLNKAKELGADYIIKVDITKDSKDLAKKIVDCLGMADQTIECSGAESSFHAGIHVS